MREVTKYCVHGTHKVEGILQSHPFINGIAMVVRHR